MERDTTIGQTDPCLTALEGHGETVQDGYFECRPHRLTAARVSLILRDLICLLASQPIKIHSLNFSVPLFRLVAQHMLYIALMDLGRSIPFTFVFTLHESIQAVLRTSTTTQWQHC